LPELARWVLPVVAVLLGFLAQNAGLYFGTRSYVLWMDEAHRPLQGLDDRHQEGSFTAASKSSWLPTLAWGLEIVTDLLPVLWFGVVMRSSNLRLWSQTLLTATLLSTLKGFMSWATVLPDEEGWEGCRERLGSDGLKYYRSQVELWAVLTDLLLLEVRGLWAGHEHRQRFCADATFSGNTYLSALFCTSLFEAVAGSLQQVEWQFAARIAVRSVLFAIVLGNMVFPVMNGYHGLADVFIALLLTVMVYSNPAVAIAVHHWCEGFATDEDCDRRPAQRELSGNLSPLS
ncbi:unnamed protein product, partial [Polarella glacialis]